MLQLGMRADASTHSRLKAAGQSFRFQNQGSDVSTHSRLKAAGYRFRIELVLSCSFNTQPPEGGWTIFTHHPLDGRVSTHSRLKAAGVSRRLEEDYGMGFNTQPPEGGWARKRDGVQIRHLFQHTAA